MSRRVACRRWLCVFLRRSRILNADSAMTSMASLSSEQQGRQPICTELQTQSRASNRCSYVECDTVHSICVARHPDRFIGGLDGRCSVGGLYCACGGTPLVSQHQPSERDRDADCDPKWGRCRNCRLLWHRRLPFERIGVRLLARARGLMDTFRTVMRRCDARISAITTWPLSAKCACKHGPR